MSSSVCIVGGGLVGLLTAFRLAERKLDVTLVDMNELGSGASFAAAGMLAPQAEHEQDDALFRLGLAARDGYFALCERLETISGKPITRGRSGLAYVALDEVQAKKLKARVQWQKAAGCKAEWTDDARSVHKEIAAEMAGAAILSDEAWVAPRELLVAAGRAARLAGVKTLERRRVVKIDNAVHLEGGEVVNADQIVLAAGAWSSRIAGVQLEETAIEPVRGALIQADWSPHTLDTIIALRGGYVVPRGGGSVIIGTSSEDAGFEATVTLEAIASIEARVHRVIPSLGNARIVDRWAGLRPYARRDRPIVAKAGNVIYATGHYRNGVLLAPITAEIVDALVSGERHPHADIVA